MSIWAVVQARLGSTRLPRKVFKDIGGRTMLERVVERAKQIGYPVCIAIPEKDRTLAALCVANDWRYIEGSEEDVLGRYVEAARQLDADHVVRVTADCPFLDVEAAKWTVKHHLQTGAGLTTYHLAEGRGVEVFTRHALEESDRLCPPDMRDSPDRYLLECHNNLRVEYMKFSVDTLEDLELARRRANGQEAPRLQSGGGEDRCTSGRVESPSECDARRRDSSHVREGEKGQSAAQTSERKVMATGLEATLGQTAANKGGTHGGINPDGALADTSHTPTPSSGNPGLTVPWEGTDATLKPGELPPLKSL